MPVDSKVRMLPIWKTGATATERLYELSVYAAENPERFERFVICYQETLPNGNLQFRTLQFGCKLAEEVGLFEIGKVEAIKESER